MSVDFSGRWTADLSKSKLLSPRPKAMVVMVAHSEPDLRQEITVTKDDGSEQRIVFECRTNGETDRCRLDGKEVRGQAQWRGEELVIELWMRHGDREIYLCDCWSLSPDRQTLTMEHRDDALAGQVTFLRRMN